MHDLDTAVTLTTAAVPVPAQRWTAAATAITAVGDSVWAGTVTVQTVPDDGTEPTASRVRVRIPLHGLTEVCDLDADSWTAAIDPDIHPHRAERAFAAELDDITIDPPSGQVTLIAARFTLTSAGDTATMTLTASAITDHDCPTTNEPEPEPEPEPETGTSATTPATDDPADNAETGETDGDGDGDDSDGDETDDGDADGDETDGDETDGDADGDDSDGDETDGDADGDGEEVPESVEPAESDDGYNPFDLPWPQRCNATWDAWINANNHWEITVGAMDHERGIGLFGIAEALDREEWDEFAAMTREAARLSEEWATSGCLDYDDDEGRISYHAKIREAHAAFTAWGLDYAAAKAGHYCAGAAVRNSRYGC